MKIKNYLLATRFPFLSASILPVIFSGIWCWKYQEHYNFLFFLLSLILVILFHLSANTINDYFDWDKSDKINKYANPFSGGSRKKIEKFISRKFFFILSIIFIFISLIILEFLYLNGRRNIFLIGMIGILFGMFYSTPPFSFQSKGLGEFIIFLSFGPLLTFGSCYSITGIMALKFLLLGFPFGILTALIIWINEFPDYEADKTTGKNNLVVILGLKKARYGYGFLIIFYYFILIFLILLDIFPLYSLFSFITLFIAIQNLKTLWGNYDKPEKLVNTQKFTILFHNINSLILIVSILIAAGAV